MPEESDTRDEDVGIYNLLLEDAVRSFLVVGHDILVTLFLEPLFEPELVLDGAEQSRLLLGKLSTFVEDRQDFLLGWRRRGEPSRRVRERGSEGGPGRAGEEGHVG